MNWKDMQVAIYPVKDVKKYLCKYRLIKEAAVHMQKNDCSANS